MLRVVRIFISYRENNQTCSRFAWGQRKNWKHAANICFTHLRIFVLISDVYAAFVAAFGEDARQRTT